MEPQAPSVDAPGAALDLWQGAAGSAVTGLVMVAAALALWPLCAFLVLRLVPGRRVFFARWGFSHVALVLVVFYVAARLIAPLVGGLVGVGYPPVLASLCGGVLIFGVVTATIFWLALKLDPDGLASLGLRGGGLARASAAGLLSYVLLLPGVLGLGLFWPWAMRFLELEYSPQEVAMGLLEMSAGELALAVPMAVLVVPFLEEVVFRGFLQPLLVQNLGDRGGVVATSAVFGLLHGQSASLPIFGLSLILGGVMLRTQRLLAPCLVHMLHNGLMVFLLLGSEAMRDTLLT